jgi:radical SAM protein with 4Fe4S-binding SPASM domain
VSERGHSSIKTADLSDLWQGKPPFLAHLDIELTERCNNDCIHCSIRQPEDCIKARERELHANDIKDILAQAADLGALTVRFTGGEPLLRDDFEEIYLFARNLGLTVLLFTNARLITPELADLFMRIPPMRRIEITVYGISESSYETATRTKGSYASFRHGIGLLLKKNVPFIIKGAALPALRRELDEFEAWAATVPWMERPPSLAMLFNLRDRRDSPERNSTIKKARLSPEEYLSILNRRRAGYLKDSLSFCSSFIGPPGDLLFACGAGQTPCVDAYGNLQMCLPLRHPETIYPLGAGSLHDGMAFFFAKAREMRAADSSYLERCARCFLKGLCEQCPAKSWSEHGTLDTPVDYFCDIAHALARDLRLLSDCEKGWQAPNWRERLAKLQ